MCVCECAHRGSRNTSVARRLGAGGPRTATEESPRRTPAQPSQVLWKQGPRQATCWGAVGGVRLRALVGPASLGQHGPRTSLGCPGPPPPCSR